MTNQKIIDNNRLIAIFMDNYQKLSNDFQFGRFHLQWDWLMPVVEKIENLEEFRFDITIRQKTITIFDKNNNEEIYCFFGKGDNKLEVTYQGIIGFIKWYTKKE